jgi:hypothetical protein
MATSVAPDVGLNRVVVAFLDGDRARGCVYDFSPLKDLFRLVGEGDSPQQKGHEVDLKDLKEQQPQNIRGELECSGREIPLKRLPEIIERFAESTLCYTSPPALLTEN